MITKIIKRDGNTVPFNTVKIAKAINKAFAETKEPFRGDDGADTLAAQVVSTLERKYPDPDNKGITVSIEEVQDTVESILMLSYTKTAKAYILYRSERSRIRDKNSRLMKSLTNIVTDDSSDLKRENANIDGNTAMGTMLKIGSEASKAHCNLCVINPKHSAAHTNGDIHIHDMDFLSIGTTTCTQIDMEHLFNGGFNTGHGYLREPSNIQTAAQLVCIAIQANQNEQHGGQSIPNFDRFMAPYVAKTYIKQLARVASDIEDVDDDEILDNFKKDLTEVTTKNNRMILTDKAMEDVKSVTLKYFPKADVDKLLAKTSKYVDRLTYQAMEALIHNLNTLHSRAGAQVPFSSINYGTDTSEEARMVVKNLLLATEAGLGNGETPIFPIQIFRCKKGVNFLPGDPNYDLYQLSLRVTAKRLFPNYSFQDAPFNAQYYKEGHPETEIGYMGCRTRVIGNVNGPETTYRRGNLSFTSINLPRLGIEANGDWDEFYKLLDEKLDLVANQLLERFELQCRKKVKNFPFLMGEGNWLNAEKLGKDDDLREILKNGSLGIGFIGIAETLVAMTGAHHGESAESWEKAYEIVSRIRDYCDKKTQETHLNFSCLATPAEGLAGRFVKIDRQKYGVIEGVTDRDYYTNSFHVPVYYPINAFNKIKKEAPFHALTNGGHISYIEMDGDPAKNIEALDKVVHYMDEMGIGYGAVNHPVDRCCKCGYTGVIDDACPMCNNDNENSIDRIRRITGYLVGTLDRFNNGKKAEEHDRVKHI